MRLIAVCLTILLTATPGISQDTLGLAAPGNVIDSGLLKHILPRFSLKTGVRVVADPQGTMRLSTDATGTPVFRDDQATYHLQITPDPKQERFRDWLLSDIGKRTIESFEPDSGTSYSADVGAAKVEVSQVIEGDAAKGSDLAFRHCGRCHVIGPRNRMNGLGSTPSFAVLRALPDWIVRFEEFFVRKPHGAFTQIEDVTPPFAPERPPPIVPLEMTIDDLDAIIAFVSGTKAADLGAPLQLQ